MVEFTIAATLLLFVLLAVMEFGQAMYVYNLVTNDARLGARYAMVRGSQCTFSDCPATQTTIQNYVRSVSSNINTNNLTVTATWATVPADGCVNAGPPANGPGCLVTVTAKYPFQTFGSVPLNINISSTSKMYISR